MMRHTSQVIVTMTSVIMNVDRLFAFADFRINQASDRTRNVGVRPRRSHNSISKTKGRPSGRPFST